MADSLSPTSPEYINVNCDSKPDTSKFNKDLSFNKDDVNQNKDYEKCSSSDKFKNSPLLPDKKHLLSPRSSPQPRRVSPSQPEQKVINSPPPVVEQFKSPSPAKEEKIINSPRSARSSVSNSQEFRIINPTSRSASVSSQVESPVHSSQDFIVQRNRSHSDNDSLGDAEILELLSDDATEGPAAQVALNANLDDVFSDTANFASEAANISNGTINLDHDNAENSIHQNTELELGDTVNSASDAANISNETINLNFENAENSLYQNTDELGLNNSNDLMLIDDDLLDETIAELQLLEADGLLDESYDKDIHGSIEIIQNRSSVQFDTEEALSGLLEIAEMADDFGLADDSVDNMSQAMSAWIEESIDNLKDMLKKTIQRPSKRKNTAAPNNSRLSKLQNPTKAAPQKQSVSPSQKQAVVAPNKKPTVAPSQKQTAALTQKKAAAPNPKQPTTQNQKQAIAPQQKQQMTPQKQHMTPQKQHMTPQKPQMTPKRRQPSIPDEQKVMTPNRSKVQAPKTVKNPSTGKACPASQYTENVDSPLSRFSQPSSFEKRLAAKLTLESLKDQNDTGTSPIPNHEGSGRQKPKPISQSESGDFTGSSRTSPSGDYGSSFNSGSAYNSEPPSRSYTPSYTASYTPSDASENSDTDSSPEHYVNTGIRRPGGPSSRGSSTRGGLRAGVRGRATGVRRVRPSYSGEHLGGLVESSSAESFVSNKSEDPGVEDHPRTSLSGLRKPTTTTTRGRGLARPRVNTGTMPRPSNLGIQSPRKQASPQPPKSNIAKPSTGLQKPKPSGLQKPGPVRSGGIPKPSGIARGSAKPARGAGRSGLKKPATSKGSWDEGCY